MITYLPPATPLAHPRQKTKPKSKPPGVIIYRFQRQKNEAICHWHIPHQYVILIALRRVQ